MNTDPLAVRDVFASHYFLLAFLASLGTMQVALTISGARGLWLTPYRATTRWLGIALIIAGFSIFFAQPLWIDGPWAAGSVEADSATREWGQADWADLAGARNVNDIHGGLDGTKQAIWFPLASVLAFIVSAVIGSLNMWTISRTRSGDPEPDTPDSGDDGGISGLAHRSYFSNLPVSWRSFRLEVDGVWRGRLETADRWSVFKMILGRSSK